MPQDGALSVRVQSCTGKTVQLQFTPKGTDLTLLSLILKIC